jgi:CheY-like chemotaxis protein
MAKIMLVEDDNNLREIYEARLLAEGYEIVSAHDGEEALALAVKEKPDLIISDVMMPKISGFDMLDILRGTPETRNTKVIMMTALSQMEDKDRADKLGADRYLVKSQVTLEDVARVAKEVLEGAPTTDASAATVVADTATTAVNDPAATLPAAAAPTDATLTADAVAATAAPTNTTPDTPVTDTPVVPQPEDTVVTPPTTPLVATEPATAPASDDAVMTPAAVTSTTNDDALAAAAAALASSSVEPASNEEVAEVVTPPANQETSPPVTTDASVATDSIESAQTTEVEQHEVENQIEDFIKNNAIEPEPEPAPVEKHDLVLPGAEKEASSESLVAARPMASTPEVPVAATEPADVVDPTAAAPSTLEVPAPTETEPLESADYPTDGGVAGKKVIQPINDPTAKPNLDELLAKEKEKEEVAQILGSAGVAPPPAQPPAPGQQTRPDGHDPNMIAL